MAKMAKTISINSPVDKVFDYLSEPANLPEIWPSLVEIKDVERLPNGGTSFRWVYKMSGMCLKGTMEDIEFVANQRVVSKGKGCGVKATYIWTFQPEDGGTKIMVEVEWTVPIPVLGKLVEAFIVKQNEHEFELMLANLKDKTEA